MNFVMKNNRKNSKEEEYEMLYPLDDLNNNGVLISDDTESNYQNNINFVTKKNEINSKIEVYQKLYSLDNIESNYQNNINKDSHSNSESQMTIMGFYIRNLILISSQCITLILVCLLFKLYQPINDFVTNDVLLFKILFSLSYVLFLLLDIKLVKKFPFNWIMLIICDMIEFYVAGTIIISYSTKNLFLYSFFILLLSITLLGVAEYIKYDFTTKKMRYILYIFLIIFVILLLINNTLCNTNCEVITKIYSLGNFFTFAFFILIECQMILANARDNFYNENKYELNEYVSSSLSLFLSLLNFYICYLIYFLS